MADSITLKASCLCGSSSFTISLPSSYLPLDAHMCHCNICRKTHGTLCTFHAKIPKPSSLEGMTMYKAQPSSEVTRYFCTKCGTQMCDEAKDDNEWFISTAVVDKAEGIFKFKNHIFVTSTKDGGLSDWVPRIGGNELKSWETHTGAGPELDASWKDKHALSTPKITESDHLDVHCHCNGVSFYIQRPDYNSPSFKKDYPGLPMPGPEPRDRNQERKEGNWWIATDRSKYIAQLCVCTSCRLGSGCEVMQWAFVPTSFISLPDGSPFQRLFGTLKEYNSSENTWRRFCGTCGAVIFWQDVVERPVMLDVAVGVMDSESGAKAEEWLEWRTNKLSYEEEALNKPLADAVREGSREWVNGNESVRTNT